MTIERSSDPTRSTPDDPQDCVLLLMPPGENRRLLAEWLSPTVTVVETETVYDEVLFDLCVVDESTFRAEADALDRVKRDDPVGFLPVLLITATEGTRADPDVWDHVDDLVQTPIRKAPLRARLSNLLARRRTAIRLSDRERELEDTVEALQLTRRAIDAAPIGVSITDPNRPDNPTIYANEAFEAVTGYDRETVLGQNMRLLQGSASAEAAVAAMRSAVEAERPVSTTLINYRDDGTRFWNRVDIAPVRDDDGTVTNFVGFQTDVTDEKIREQRLSVLNRLLRHNLSNELNVIDGYAKILLDDVDGPEEVAALREIETAASELQSLAAEARTIEHVLCRCRSVDRSNDLETAIQEVCAEARESRPDLRTTVDVEAGPWQVSGYGLRVALSELIENAVEHNDAPSPAVEVTARQVGAERIEVRIADNGPGVSDDIVDMLHEGEETPLKHCDRLGLWLVVWIVTLLGGGIELRNRAEGGAVAVLVLPVEDADR